MGGQRKDFSVGFVGAIIIPEGFELFSYTLNDSHSHAVGAIKKAVRETRFVGALFRVLVFKRSLFDYFQGKREMHEK